MTIDTSREAVERLLAERDAAEAREQALLTSYDEERKALVENTSLRERLKASEAERRAQARRIAMQRKELRNLQDWFPAHEKLRWQYLDAIAERDAALAEVARLSHALAAETAKREAMEATLNDIATGAGMFGLYPEEDLQWAMSLAGSDSATLAKHGSKT